MPTELVVRDASFQTQAVCLGFLKNKRACFSVSGVGSEIANKYIPHYRWLQDCNNTILLYSFLLGDGDVFIAMVGNQEVRGTKTYLELVCLVLALTLFHNLGFYILWRLQAPNSSQS